MFQTMVEPRRLRDSWRDTHDFDTRDFDYGVGDDLGEAQRRARAEIAERIRQAARLDATATFREMQVYEIAARLAEAAA